MVLFALSRRSLTSAKALNPRTSADWFSADDRSYREAKALIESGELGNVHAIETWMSDVQDPAGKRSSSFPVFPQNLVADDFQKVTSWHLLRILAVSSLIWVSTM